MKLKKGDEVVVLAGKDVGKRGTITRVIPERDKVIVSTADQRGQAAPEAPRRSSASLPWRCAPRSRRRIWSSRTRASVRH